MRIILLTNGKPVKVSNRDYASLRNHSWREMKPRHGRTSSYAVRSSTVNGRYRVILMHRVIKAATPGTKVDHKNHDGLDNRRSNLRVATHMQNCRNRHKQRNNTSGYKGVYYCKSQKNLTKRWFTRVGSRKQNGMKFGGRYYATPEEAAHAYDRIAVELYGQFAQLNFP